jgi:hypothetical protein
VGSLRCRRVESGPAYFAPRRAGVSQEDRPSSPQLAAHVNIRRTLSARPPGITFQWARTGFQPSLRPPGAAGRLPTGSRQGRGQAGAQSYWPFGTDAQAAVIPKALAVDLPDAVGDELGTCLGIPGMTAHRAVFADGPSPARPCWCTASAAR